MFKNQVVLVTGGTGSFGSQIIPELLKTKAVEIRVFSRDEEKQLDVKREFKDARLKCFLGNVRDFDRVLEVCDGVDVVYHAAAQKVIDSCEENPVEALKTNVYGTWNVKRACLQHGVKVAVLLSTDKAVKPVNFYGMSKAMAERIWINGSGCTRFMVTRYGNVLSSRGSVVPFFRLLISQGKPLTITHCGMTRFLLTLSEAVALVFEATRNGRHGEIYVPNAPACRIVDLAAAMTSDSYPKVEVGIRCGEKIHECLIQEYEVSRVERRGKYFVVLPFGAVVKPVLDGEFTSDKAMMLGIHDIKKLLKEAKT